MQKFTSKEKMLLSCGHPSLWGEEEKNGRHHDKFLTLSGMNYALFDITLNVNTRNHKDV